MVPKEFSFLNQKSESVTHVFDLIGKAINKPQFIHLCLNILLLLGRELGFRIFPELESVSKYLSSSETLYQGIYLFSNVLASKRLELLRQIIPKAALIWRIKYRFSCPLCGTIHAAYYFSESSPPPARTQIWPAMNPVCGVNRHPLVRVGCRIRVSKLVDSRQVHKHR